MAEKKKAVPAAPEASDKKKALEAAISKIEKDYGKGTIMRLGDDIPVNVEALSTGSLSLDLALGIGGVPKGRIVEIYGPEASGKTTLALHVVASAQRAGGEAAYIDVEHALGLDVNIGGGTAVFLAGGDDVQRKRRLTGGLWPVDFNDAALRHAADAQREIQRQRTRGQSLYIYGDIVAQAHDRALAVVLLNFGDGRFQCFLFIGVSRGRNGGSLFLLSHGNSPLCL